MIFSLQQFTTSAPAKAPKRRQRRTKLDSALADIHLDSELTNLVMLRVSQIHGCKHCMREYTKKLKAKGATVRRLRLLKGWRQEAAFSLREKAALNLAEAVTCNPISSVPSMAIHVASVFFTEEELLLFILDIVAVNDWHYLRGFQHDTMTNRRYHE
jgi:AhpD family alkylhydroperoxidase